MELTKWTHRQIENGNLVEDGTGCVEKVLSAAGRLQERLQNVSAHDSWAVDKSEFIELARKYVGFAPKGL